MIYGVKQTLNIMSKGKYAMMIHEIDAYEDRVRKTYPGNKPLCVQVKLKNNERTRQIVDDILFQARDLYITITIPCKTNQNLKTNITT